MADAAGQEAAEPESLHPKGDWLTPDETLTQSVLPERLYARKGWRGSAL